MTGHRGTETQRRFGHLSSVTLCLCGLRSWRSEFTVPRFIGSGSSFPRFCAREPLALADPEAHRRRHVTLDHREARANLRCGRANAVTVDLPDVEPARMAAEALPLEILYQDAMSPC